MSSIETFAGRPVSRPQALGEIVKLVLRKLAVWSHNYRTRNQLSELSDAALEDLGLTREAARREAVRPFWDAGTRHSGTY